MQTLATDQLARFVGGQMEFQNDSEGYLYRGEIASIAIDDNALVVRFAWLAKGEGYPPLPNKWVNDSQLDYSAHLLGCTTQPSTTPDGTERLILHFPLSGEVVVLFPVDAERKLDRSKVQES